MTRASNFLPLAGFLVCAVALLSYPFFFVEFPVTRDVPWANWLLFGLGLALLGAGVVRAYRWPERYRGRIMAPILSVLGLAVLGLFVFMTEIMARQVPPSARAPQVGEKAPDFALPDAQGRTVRLADLLGGPAGASEGGARGSWALLIFYRGYW